MQQGASSAKTRFRLHILTRRKAGARSDPYSVFSKLLRNGNPPDDWNDLLAFEAAGVRIE